MFKLTVVNAKLYHKKMNRDLPKQGHASSQPSSTVVPKQ